MVRAAIAFLLVLALLSSAAHAQKRVALVIGNSAYTDAGTLANPKNDATDIALSLKTHGFQVIDGFDLNKVDFEGKVRDFSAALRGADVGLFFYAGHGLQVSGQNYLVPIDAKLENADALDWEMLRLDLVHRAMERATSTNIIFLDACRNNPLARNLARAMGQRSTEIGRGLAAVESGVGTLISFSTQPGNVALDGTGRNSPFASALVKHLAAPKDDLSAILIDVRNDVMATTQNKQVPWEHSALRGRFYFKPAGQTPGSVQVAPARLSEAAEAWDRVKDPTNIAILEAFIARYTETFYADLARARVEELKKKQVVVASLPKAPSGPSQGEISSFKVGDVVEQWQWYDYKIKAFRNGQERGYGGTKWKVLEIIPSKGVKVQLIEGKYTYGGPGFITVMFSSEWFQERFPGAPKTEQIFREFRAVAQRN